MLFQTLDDKDQCVGIYYDGKLIFSFEEFARPDKNLALQSIPAWVSWSGLCRDLCSG